jgi:hypothetical protein
VTIEAKLDTIIELLRIIVPKPAAAPPPEPPAPEPKKARAAKPAASAAPAAVNQAPDDCPPRIGTATLDDVRVALVALSTRTGSKAKSTEILEKYTPNLPHVTGSLKAEDYSAVVAACQSAG